MQRRCQGFPHLSWPGDRHSSTSNKKENIMGKYFLAWLCGVPAFLLVLIYLFVH